MDRDLLSKLEDVLTGRGINYCVFLRAYSVPTQLGRSSAQYVIDALDTSAVIESVQPVTSHDVLDNVESALNYSGDPSAGPDSEVLKSKEFRKLLVELKHSLAEKMNGAHRIEQFWLKEGHPDYPVFWDFAFLIEGSTLTDIFIGSSSD
jgi:hypothetical protein